MTAIGPANWLPRRISHGSNACEGLPIGPTSRITTLRVRLAFTADRTDRVSTLRARALGFVGHGRAVLPTGRQDIRSRVKRGPKGGHFLGEVCGRYLVDALFQRFGYLVAT